MNITAIAKYIWDNSQIVDFGNSPKWDPNLFTESWRKSKQFGSSWVGAGSGWYWFILDMTYDQLHQIHKPSVLPDKGCNIGLLSRKNRDIFSDSNLCKHANGSVVIYNGHEANVTSRIRTHYSLNNNKTGALGLKHYPLSNQKWQVRYFSTPCFTDIPNSERVKIELLMNSYSGRCAVESAWRVLYGWPILCKE